jgi:regulatory protein
MRRKIAGETPALQILPDGSPVSATLSPMFLACCTPFRLLASPPPCLYPSHMRSSPRKFSSEDDLYVAALAGLARRAYSVYEMRTYLERRADDKDVVKGVLERLKNLSYLDDERYARQFVRLHTELRKQGPFRIARDLRARGVPDRHIETALAERSPELNEGALVRERLQRRIKLLRAPLDERRVASLYRSLMRAGFAADTIRRELTALTKQSVEEIPDS